MRDTEYTQIEVIGNEIEPHLFNILQEENVKCPFFVVGRAFRLLNLSDAIKAQYPRAKFFEDFSPNPSYESVMLGINMFRQNKCDFIVAVGGGSAIDVAKCIKAYAFMEMDDCCLNQIITNNKVKILAIPTTAGTGSEATHFAVIYYQGTKKSVCHDSLLPEYVILNGKVLNSLPRYQRITTMLDALCHSIESLWSLNSTEESEKYAVDAIGLIMQFNRSYLRNEEKGNMKMLCAANYAGKAINITKTTAAHAMSYKMTSMYGIAHGHSVALCLPRVWNYMINNMDKCVDQRGIVFLNARFQYISELLGCSSPVDAVVYLDNLINEMEVDTPQVLSKEDINDLVQSVNAERLANNPVLLDETALYEIYYNILNGDIANASGEII